jgi:hypothetical protein
MPNEKTFSAYETLINSLNPLQRAMFSIICDYGSITRKKLQGLLRREGFFNGLGPASADRLLRMEKANLIYAGVPIGSTHGESSPEANRSKKTQKGYFLVLSLSSEECRRAIAEYDQKMEACAKTKNAFVSAVKNFPEIPKKGKPAKFQQPSLFQEALI